MSSDLHADELEAAALDEGDVAVGVERGEDHRRDGDDALELALGRLERLLRLAHRREVDHDALAVHGTPLAVADDRLAVPHPADGAVAVDHAVLGLEPALGVVVLVDLLRDPLAVLRMDHVEPVLGGSQEVLGGQAGELLDLRADVVVVAGLVVGAAPGRRGDVLDERAEPALGDLHALLGGAQVRQVPHARHVRVRAEWRQRDLDRHAVTVAMHRHGLDALGQRLVPADDCGEARPVLVGEVLGGHEVDQRAPDRRGGDPAERALGARAPAQDAPLGVDLDEAVGGDVEHRGADALLAPGGGRRLAQLELGDDGGGDVLEHADVRGRPVPVAVHDAQRPDDAPVGAADRDAGVGAPDDDDLTGRDDPAALLGRPASGRQLVAACDAEHALAQQRDPAGACAERARGETARRSKAAGHPLAVLGGDCTSLRSRTHPRPRLSRLLRLWPLGQPPDTFTDRRTDVRRRVAQPRPPAAAVGEHGGHARRRRARAPRGRRSRAGRAPWDARRRAARRQPPKSAPADRRRRARGHAPDRRVGRRRLGRRRRAAEVERQREHEQAAARAAQPGGDRVEVALVGGEVEVGAAHVVDARVQARDVVVRRAPAAAGRAGRRPRRAVDGRSTCTAGRARARATAPTTAASRRAPSSPRRG